MAEADLDTLIRSIAKKEIKALTSAAKGRHGRLMGLAAKAKDKDAKARYKHLAKATMLHASAAARRLQITAENTADAYKRAMAKAAEEAQAIKPAKKAVPKKATKKKN
jgi:transcriptional regulator of nitric oxide reductase